MISNLSFKGTINGPAEFGIRLPIVKKTTDEYDAKILSGIEKAFISTESTIKLNEKPSGLNINGKIVCFGDPDNLYLTVTDPKTDQEFVLSSPPRGVANFNYTKFAGWIQDIQSKCLQIYTSLKPKETENNPKTQDDGIKGPDPNTFIP